MCFTLSSTTNRQFDYSTVFHWDISESIFVDALESFSNESIFQAECRCLNNKENT